MLIGVTKEMAMNLYKDGEKVFCNGEQITPSWEYGGHASKDELFSRGVHSIIGYGADEGAAKYEADRTTPQRVKKISGGIYRVYGVHRTKDDFEVRYAKKSDAESFMHRCGGYLIWQDFEDRLDAQKYLTENLGFIWW